MNKIEFMNHLQDALRGEVPTRVLNENINYYNNYIEEETKKGITEETIMELLGDPRLIAKTIMEANGNGSFSKGEHTYYTEDTFGEEPVKKEDRPIRFRQYDLTKWYWKLLGGVIGIAFVTLVFFVLTGVAALIFRFLGPILLICLFFSLFKNNRR